MLKKLLKKTQIKFKIQTSNNNKHRKMRFTNVVMWSFFTAFFLLYLIAIRLVRGQFIISSSPQTSSTSKLTNYQREKFVDFNYHNHESMETIMRTFSQTYPKLCHLYSIGKSVQGMSVDLLSLLRYN